MYALIFLFFVLLYLQAAQELKDYPEAQRNCNIQDNDVDSSKPVRLETENPEESVVMGEKKKRKRKRTPEQKHLLNLGRKMRRNLDRIRENMAKRGRESQKLNKDRPIQ